MLQHWSFAKVALVSGGWVVACFLVALPWVVNSSLECLQPLFGEAVASEGSSLY